MDFDRPDAMLVTVKYCLGAIALGSLSAALSVQIGFQYKVVGVSGSANDLANLTTKPEICIPRHAHTFALHGGAI